MKKIALLLLTGALFTGGLSAQRKCGAMEHLHRITMEDPSILQNRDAIEQFTQNFAASGGAGQDARAIITIPVVVHVVYNTSAQNISDAQIQSQIDVLNRDYHKLNADWTSTPSAFQGLVADCQIQFCLAQRDPNGNATTGVIRKSTTVTSFSTNDAVKKTSQGGDDAWPSSSYLNLWVCNISGGILGYAQFPGGAAATDGVVINYTAFGNTGTAAAPYNLGRTATHEVGHWLNLYHIWGDDGTACTGSDNVGDTPNQAGENYGCPTYPHVSCSNGPNGDMFMNYMDYTDDACMYMFSAGQNTRMQSLFAAGGARYSLLSSLGCQPPVAAACGAVTNLSAGSVTQTSATLSWTAVSGATSYNVQYKTSTATTWTTTSTTGTSLALSGLTAGTSYNYQVQSVCAAGNGNYTASSFTTTANTTTCTDAYESNNSLSAAKTIAVNTNITALISSSTDNDYFKFTNTSTQKNIRISLTNLPADYDVRLYKSNGTQVASSANGGTTSETIKYNNATVGTYYVRIYGYNGAYSTTSCYTLNASISSTAFREEEEELSVPKTLSDINYTLYPNPSSGVITVEMNFDDVMDRVEIKAYDLTGREIRSNNYSDVQGQLKTSLDLSDMPNGIYQVVINSPMGRETRKVIISK